MIELRPYQKQIINRGKIILDQYKILYLAMEVRTGKTLTALNICKDLSSVLFITKKKAISSIENDYILGEFDFAMCVINYESLHKVQRKKWACIITDEAHGMGAFPKPTKRAKDVKKIFDENPNSYHILLSGTPTPESYSQIYHQFWPNPNSPFKEYKKFYAWARTFVNVVQKRVAYGRLVNDYSNADKKKVFEDVSPLMIRFTQKQAKFTSTITETVLHVKMNESTYKVCDRLAKDLIINEQVIADTPVKLQSKLHQMYSGTIKFEDGTRKPFDFSKGEFIKEYFKGKKIAIFYKFIAELELLKIVFKDDLTTDLDEFNTSDKHIALQIISGREGISLRKADALVFYNIDFSATSYWQARDRMTTKDRPINNIYWIFSKDGIEDKIFKAVTNKKTYTNFYFKQDYNVTSKQFKLL